MAILLQDLIMIFRLAKNVSSSSKAYITYTPTRLCWGQQQMRPISAFRMAIYMKGISLSTQNREQSLVLLIGNLLAFAHYGQTSVGWGGSERIPSDSSLALMTLETLMKIMTQRTWRYGHSFAPSCTRGILIYSSFLGAVELRAVLHAAMDEPRPLGETNIFLTQYHKLGYWKEQRRGPSLGI